MTHLARNVSCSITLAVVDFISLTLSLYLAGDAANLLI